MKRGALIATVVVAATTVLAADAPAEPAAFHVDVSGTGRAIILIPGLASPGSVWDGTVAELSKSYECHVLTLAGFAGLPSIGAPVLEKERDAVVRYVREKKLDHPVVIGHSLGGFLALWLAATYPDDFGSIVTVDGLPYVPALQDPHATPDTSRKMAEQMKTHFEAMDTEAFATQNRLAVASMISDPKQVEAVAKAGGASDPKAVAEAVYEAMTTDIRGEMSKIKAKTLLIGALPPTVPKEMWGALTAAYEAQIAAIPNHEVAMANRALHFVMLDKPEWFQKKLGEFLAAPQASAETSAPIVWPVLLKRVNPVPPDAFYSSGVEGEVSLQVTVGEDGAVKELKTLSCKTRARRDRELSVEPTAQCVPYDEAARKAVSRYEYRPATQGGKPIEVLVLVKIAFSRSYR